MTNTKTKYNPFKEFKFSVSENMAQREFVEISYNGAKSDPFKIKAETRAEFFNSQSEAMKIANSVNEFYGEETPMLYFLLEDVATGEQWHYLEVL